MSDTPETGMHPPNAFAYEAQTDDGRRVAGVLEARDTQAAQEELANMRLRVIELRPDSGADASGQSRFTPRALSNEDFAAFNQQLAHLTATGMPVERGLRLIAQDVGSGRLSDAIRRLADDLQRGLTLDQALKKHRRWFPALYARLVEAGVKTGNLSGMLLNFGRHLELMQRLRGMLWKSLSYPVLLLIGTMLLVSFLGLAILPRFKAIYDDFDTELPTLTKQILATGQYAPAAFVVLIAMLILWPMVWAAMRASGRDQWFIETFIFPLPLVGPVMKHNLIARWCDALKLGVQAHLDLPGAIELAGQAVNSPSLKRDGETLTQAIAVGQPLEASVIGRVLPSTVTAAIDLAGNEDDLTQTLRTLADLHQQQAEMRLSTVQTFAMPITLIIFAASMILICLSLFLPLIKITQSIM